MIEEILFKFLDIHPGQVNVNNDQVLELVAKMVGDLEKCDKVHGIVKNFLMPLPPRTHQALVKWFLDGLKGALKSELKRVVLGEHHDNCLMRIKSFRQQILIASMFD